VFCENTYDKDKFDKVEYRVFRELMLNFWVFWCNQHQRYPHSYITSQSKKMTEISGWFAKNIIEAPEDHMDEFRRGCRLSI
jgi:hypothetical protein